MHEQTAALGDQDLAAFAAKLSIFRAALTASERRLLDEVLLAAADTGEVQGYGFDAALGRQAALAAIAALGLTLGTLGTPRTSHAAPGPQAQAIHIAGGLASNSTTSATTPQTSEAPSIPATAPRIGGPGAIGPSTLLTPLGPVAASTPEVSQADVQAAIGTNESDITEAEQFKRLAEDEAARLAGERAVDQPPTDRERALRTEIQFWESQLAQLRAFGDRLQLLLQ